MAWTTVQSGPLCSKPLNPGQHQALRTGLNSAVAAWPMMSQLVLHPIMTWIGQWQLPHTGSTLAVAFQTTKTQSSIRPLNTGWTSMNCAPY